MVRGRRGLSQFPQVVTILPFLLLPTGKESQGKCQENPGIGPRIGKKLLCFFSDLSSCQCQKCINLQ